MCNSLRLSVERLKYRYPMDGPSPIPIRVRFNQNERTKKQCPFFQTEIRNQFEFSGITVQNERIPSGVFSALENANITDSVLNSYNDVNLRWIAKDKWKYSLDFDSKFQEVRQQTPIYNLKLILLKI